jgi:hypothetical protein
MQCLLYKIYFWKGFSYVLQIDMQLICAPMLTKFYSCKKWVLQVWFEKNKNSLNLKFKSYNTSWMGQTRRDFIQASKIHNELLSGTVAATVTLGVSQPSPPNRNLIPRLGRSSGSNRHSEQLYHSSLWQDEVWMARMEEVFAFSSCFFFRVVAPLYLEEFDCFTPRDTILLIQDLD